MGGEEGKIQQKRILKERKLAEKALKMICRYVKNNECEKGRRAGFI